MTPLACALFAAALSDAPRAVVLLPETGAREVLAATAELPPALLEARKLAEQLRYEEAVVEYQRYLALPERPLTERAAALLELGFIHLVLGDEANAEARAIQALELDAELPAPKAAPKKQKEFLEAMRRQFNARARLQVDQRRSDDAPNAVRVTVADPERKVRRVLLRHAVAPTGPYFSTEMSCDGDACTGAIPPPTEATGFTAWYYVEAFDDAQATAAKVAGPDAPLQVVVVEQRAWYQNPVVWGVSGAALVGLATVVYFLAPQPPR